MKELLSKLQENLKELTRRPDFITEIDSDPRWDAIRTIEIATGKEIEWDWEYTDFSSIGGTPIVIEHGDADKISFTDLVTKVLEIVGEGHMTIESDKLIVILAKHTIHIRLKIWR